MSEIETSKAELDLKALEDFVVGNEDLERLEVLIDRFNIFEATGFIRQELRHSDFLRFLLDPKGTHGLGDAFVNGLLKRVLATTGDTSVSVAPRELELWNLNQVKVQREWQYVDILLLDEEHELAVIIENKIDSGERSGQLQRYRDVVEQLRPGWRIIPIYLTPSGEDPSYEIYLPVSYGLVCDVIDDIVRDKTSLVNPDMVTLMTHYTEMLRRHIVGDSEIATLCRQIYYQHKRALDLIYEHRGDAPREVKTIVGELIEAEPRLDLDKTITNWIKFAYPEWDQPILLTATGGFSRLNRILLFQFWYHADGLQLILFVGPGPAETRQKLIEMANSHPDTFRKLGAYRDQKDYKAIYILTFLEGEEMHEDPLYRDRKIRKRWAEFLEQDLPGMDTLLKGEEWIWESAEADE